MKIRTAALITACVFTAGCAGPSWTGTYAPLHGSWTGGEGSTFSLALEQTERGATGELRSGKARVSLMLAPVKNDDGVLFQDAQFNADVEVPVQDLTAAKYPKTPPSVSATKTISAGWLQVQLRREKEGYFTLLFVGAQGGDHAVLLYRRSTGG